MNGERLGLGILSLCFVALALQMFHNAQILFGITFGLLSVISSLLIINSQNQEEEDARWPTDWEDYKANYSTYGHDDSCYVKAEEEYFRDKYNQRALENEDRRIMLGDDPEQDDDWEKIPF